MPGGIFANEAILQPVEPLNNGVDGGLDNGDNGVGDVSGDEMDNGLFKSPSLRNIAVTGPYMHDGRFATLAEVVDFYSDDVQPHVNLDPRLRDPQTNQPRRLNLTPAERQALVAFLETLTDEALLDDVRFSDPFAG
jgi:cytochrome c peroxidase